MVFVGVVPVRAYSKCATPSTVGVSCARVGLGSGAKEQAAAQSSFRGRGRVKDAANSKFGKGKLTVHTCLGE